MQVIKLIVLDNEPDIVTSLIEAFDDRFIVNGFTNLEDCLSYLTKGAEVDLILTDYNFNAEMNGLDYITIIRSVLAFEIPFILVTGSNITDLEQLTKMGCAVVQKPFNVNYLMKQVVDVWLNHIENEISSVRRA